jgi:hypothetical protein
MTAPTARPPQPPSGCGWPARPACNEAIKEVTIAQAHDVPEEQRLTPDLICGPTKTHTVRTVSIPATIRPLLEAHLATAPRPNDLRAFVFTMPNGSPVRHGNFYSNCSGPVTWSVGGGVS